MDSRSGDRAMSTIHVSASFRPKCYILDWSPSGLSVNKINQDSLGVVSKSFSHLQLSIIPHIARLFSEKLLSMEDSEGIDLIDAF
jgi:hypothetical protein